MVLPMIKAGNSDPKRYNLLPQKYFLMPPFGKLEASGSCCITDYHQIARLHYYRLVAQKHHAFQRLSQLMVETNVCNGLLFLHCPGLHG